MAPNDSPPYRTVLILACGATFMGLLDSTAVSFALADLHREFPMSSMVDLSWVLTVYTVLFAAVLAPAGRIADVLGRGRLFGVGVGLFTLASLSCALAPDLRVLLAVRGIQGAAAAMMIPASLAVILADTPPERRSSAIGAWSAAAAAGAAFGPLVGGVLISTGGWRSIFLVNLPAGVLLLFLGRRLPRQSVVAWRNLPDGVGTVLLGGGVGLVSFGVAQAASWTWSDDRTLVCLVGGVVMLAWSVTRSYRHPRPALETSLWRIRSFAVANVVSVFFGAFMYTWFLMGSLFLTSVWKYSEMTAGLAMAPAALTAAAISLALGKTVARRHPQVTVQAGCLVFACAATWQALQLSGEPNFLGLWLPSVVLCGAGIGATLTTVASAGVRAVDPQRYAGATGLNMAVRQLGGALGLATLATIVATKGITEPDAFADVALFSASAAVLAALAGAGLALRGRHRRKVPTRPFTRSAQPVVSRPRRDRAGDTSVVRSRQQSWPVLTTYRSQGATTGELPVLALPEPAVPQPR